jgi:hypothetical protein
VAVDVPPDAGPASVGDLSEEDWRTLWEQFATVYSHSQETFDSSVRTLASAGLGVTVSIGTALHAFSGRAILAVIAFLLSLGLNLVSYGTTQLDMSSRLRTLRTSRRYEDAERSRWTRVTTGLNIAAGAAFVTGGGFLAAFVNAAT